MNKEEGIKKYIGELPTTIEERLENLQSLLQLKTMEIANLKEQCQKLKQRVVDLEETNIVLPKLKKGETIYFIKNNKIERGSFQNFTSKSIECEILINPKKHIDSDDWEDWDFDLEFIDHDKIYKTKEEALAELERRKKLKGGVK